MNENGIDTPEQVLNLPSRSYVTATRDGQRRPPASVIAARAASGHEAAAPPSSVMNSRRLNGSNCILSPSARVGWQDSEGATNSLSS